MEYDLVCEEALLVMQAVIDGEASPEEVTALNRHMSHCRDCAELYKELSYMSQNVSYLKPTTPDNLTNSVMLKLRKAKSADAERGVFLNKSKNSDAKRSTKKIKLWIAAGAFTVAAAAITLVTIKLAGVGAAGSNIVNTSAVTDGYMLADEPSSKSDTVSFSADSTQACKESSVGSSGSVSANSADQKSLWYDDISGISDSADSDSAKFESSLFSSSLDSAIASEPTAANDSDEAAVAEVEASGSSSADTSNSDVGTSAGSVSAKSSLDIPTGYSTRLYKIGDKAMNDAGFPGFSVIFLCGYDVDGSILPSSFSAVPYVSADDNYRIYIYMVEPSDSGSYPGGQLVEELNSAGYPTTAVPNINYDPKLYDDQVVLGVVLRVK